MPNPELVNHAALQAVAVIIPALNEEHALPRVLQDLPDVGQVIVVDNGSTDSTARVAAEHGAVVIHEPNRGYGAACLKGIEYLQSSSAADSQNTAARNDAGNRRHCSFPLERSEPASPVNRVAPQVIVFLDGDYSDHPEMLPQLVAPVFRGEADLVIGSRLRGERQRGAMPLQSIVGNRLACVLMRWLFDADYTDIGPFRAIDYHKLLGLGMRDRNFGWTIEMQIKAAQLGLRTTEIPVPYRRRIGRSKISGTLTGTIKASYKILWTIARYGFFARSRT